MKNGGKPTLGDDCDGFDEFDKCYRTKLQYINLKIFLVLKEIIYLGTSYISLISFFVYSD